MALIEEEPSHPRRALLMRGVPSLLAALAISVAQLVSGGAFWVDVLAGVIDSLVFYKPTSVSTTITAGRDGARPYLMLTPLPVPSGGGLSISGVF